MYAPCGNAANPPLSHSLCNNHRTLLATLWKDDLCSSSPPPLNPQNQVWPGSEWFDPKQFPALSGILPENLTSARIQRGPGP